MNMTEPSIVFDFAEADYDAFNRHFLDTSPFATRTIRKWQAFLALAGILPIAVIYVTDDTRSVLFAVFTITYVVCYLIYLVTYFPARYRKKWMGRIKQLSTDHPVNAARFGRNRFKIVGDTLETESPLGSSRFHLSKLEKCTVTEKHAFLYIDGQTAIVVPRHGLIEGDFDSFLAAVLEHVHTEQLPKSVVP